MVNQPPSKISGYRSHVFGEVLFVDHAELKYAGKRFCVLLILDGATSLLSVYPQTSILAESTLAQLRSWMYDHNCKPVNIVADMYFSTDDFRAFYA